MASMAAPISVADCESFRLDQHSALAAKPRTLQTKKDLFQDFSSLAAFAKMPDVNWQCPLKSAKGRTT
jgi:hypothetical protein